MMEDNLKKYYLDCDCNCAETILRVLGERYTLELTEKDVHLLSGFGGGCGCGKICGALAASVAALGSMMVESRAHATPGFREACGELCARFEAALGSTECAELKPRYFQPEVRCLAVLEKAADCFEAFARENLGK